LLKKGEPLGSLLEDIPRSNNELRFSLWIDSLPLQHCMFASGNEYTPKAQEIASKLSLRAETGKHRQA
jgi:hypothetical protein